jgi:hypothetical protein
LSLELKYPPFGHKLKKEKDKTFLFDPLRKKWLALTPEEWVRQHLVNYLIKQHHVSPSLIAMERELKLNDLSKRFDVVVYDREMKPWLIAECKAPYIALDLKVAEQVLRYNLILKAPYVMISNGVGDMVFDKENRLVELPDYSP